MKSFADWLREIELERYAAVFGENDIDFSVVHKLTEADLKELGVTLVAAFAAWPRATGVLTFLRSRRISFPWDSASIS